MLDTEGFGDGYKYAYPDFKRDVKRTDNLDELVQASDLAKSIQEIGAWKLPLKA